MSHTEKVDVNVEFAHMFPSEMNYPDALHKRLKGSLIRTQEVIRQIESSGKSFCLSVLIDDVNDPSDAPIDLDGELMRTKFQEWGLPLDCYLLESELASSAGALLEMLGRKAKDVGGAISFSTRSRDFALLREEPETRPWELFRSRQFSTKDDAGRAALRAPRNLMSSAIMLKVPEEYEEKYPIKYTCTTLAACWLLARLGVYPFIKATKHLQRFTETPFQADKALTILPLEYLTVESYALQLIRNISDPSIGKLWQNVEYVFTGTGSPDANYA